MKISDEEFLFRTAVALTAFAIASPGWKDALILGLTHNVLILVASGFQFLMHLIFPQDYRRAIYFLSVGGWVSIATAVLSAFFNTAVSHLGILTGVYLVNTLILVEALALRQRVLLGLLVWGGGLITAVIRSAWLPETWGALPASAFFLVGVLCAAMKSIRFSLPTSGPGSDEGR